eukprot:6715022-Pyramimonas_sp.AAC.1
MEHGEDPGGLQVHPPQGHGGLHARHMGRARRGQGTVPYCAVLYCTLPTPVTSVPDARSVRADP